MSHNEETPDVAADDVCRALNAAASVVYAKAEQPANPAERLPDASRLDANYRALTDAFRAAQAEVPVDNSLSRWAHLADMQDRLAKMGLCDPSTSPAPKLVGQRR